MVLRTQNPLLELPDELTVMVVREAVRAPKPIDMGDIVDAVCDDRPTATATLLRTYIDVCDPLKRQDTHPCSAAGIVRWDMQCHRRSSRTGERVSPQRPQTLLTPARIASRSLPSKHETLEHRQIRAVQRQHLRPENRTCGKAWDHEHRRMARYSASCIHI